MTLDTLRAELGQIDKDILELVAKRQAVALKIGQVKRDRGIPTRDFRQERDVIERARANAVAHGLSPALGEELVLALIRGSLTIQEKDTVAASGEGSGRRALVIGGCGNMGRWFVRYLTAQGFRVDVADPAIGARSRSITRSSSWPRRCPRPRRSSMRWRRRPRVAWCSMSAR